MISVIVCSRSSIDLSAFIANVEQTIGVEYEIVPIDNSQNTYSIFSAYNEGIALSKGNLICLVHEDVCFRTFNWGAKLEKQLSGTDVGIVGLAGGGFVGMVPDSWKNKFSYINIIQSDRYSKKSPRKVLVPANNDLDRREVVLLDGVFLAGQKVVFEKLRFDEQLGGFHGYDLDICLQSYCAGYKNYVVYGFELEHFSKGKRDQKYFRNLMRIFRKWETHLPLALPYVTNGGGLSSTKQLFRLLFKLISRKFQTDEIVENIVYFAKKSNAIFLLKLKPIVHFFTFCIRLFLKIKNLF